MSDHVYDDLGIALSFYSEQNQHDYDDEDEETDEEYETDARKQEKSELACPFCSEDFDVLGLCCHIDADHRMEVKPGICPLCSTKVRINMASHVITQHESVLKSLCNKKNGSARSRSALLALRNDLQAKHLRKINESHSVDSSLSNVPSDSKLLSFINNPKHGHKPQTNQAVVLDQTSLSPESSSDDLLERIQPSPSTDWAIERRIRCECVQEILLSTIFDNL